MKTDISAIPTGPADGGQYLCGDPFLEPLRLRLPARESQGVETGLVDDSDLLNPSVGDTLHIAKGILLVVVQS